MQNLWGSLCTVGKKKKNHSNKNKDMALQVEQWVLSATHAAGISLLALIHSKRRDGKTPNLKCFRGIMEFL